MIVEHFLRFKIVYLTFIIYSFAYLGSDKWVPVELHDFIDLDDIGDEEVSLLFPKENKILKRKLKTYRRQKKRRRDLTLLEHTERI